MKSYFVLFLSLVNQFETTILLTILNPICSLMVSAIPLCVLHLYSVDESPLLIVIVYLAFIFVGIICFFNDPYVLI
jgi:hypothetical protein